VTLMLDEKVEADINIESDEGKITCDFELKDKVEEENLLSGIINEPGAKLRIKNRHGDILVKKRV